MDCDCGEELVGSAHATIAEATTGKWFDASAYQPRVDEFLGQLGSELHAPLTLTLANSTTLLSSVMWPERLRGGPLLAFAKIEPRNIVLRAIGLKSVRLELSTEVVNAVLLE